ncbi:PD-(D/E)XK nuclease-like domain-containing protein [Klebsiella michiganensis]|uniref:RecE family exodeoxyribonuclease n=1 Tax=Klebsiella TaxID=570 RepID=UPI0006509724|nr:MULTISPECIES: RecE family exodeoxyribonuclease [Klebsiella]KLY10694.1 exodeoxyribonuclease VIII [Klebsiella oxytoca]MCW9446495.1 PD-(D/E)XK nuclease-like domain-containing protein [Klebsiella oxytoca]MCW9474594.1 PD-(D/E)XK nuclease-like domain-containing protein [Klebsiella grimontii]MCW9529018.1 PD-(D/E)XK nuclease-like domain-containing protein [Klebsiella grimontii]MDS7856448.1 PD-(D/E)XK nuclease-like domain-containing protein [Klebsiella michiganensis]
MEYFYLIKATQKSGKADAIIWRSAKSEARAQLQLDVDLEDAEIETGRGKDYLKPIRTDFPVFNDLPAEGVLDFEWCKRYQLGDDQRTWQVIPGAVAGSTTVVEDEIVNDDSDDNDSAASDDAVSGDENSLYNLAEMPFRIQLLAQHMAEEGHVYHISIPHRGRLSAMEMDTDNSAIQDLILSTENEPEIKKFDMPSLWKYTSACKKVFPEGKRHELGKRIEFAKLWVKTAYVDRGILVKEWASGNRITSVQRTDAGTNAGGGNKTDRNPDYVHTLDTLDQEIALATLPMDFDIYDFPASIHRRAKEIIAAKESPWKEWSVALRSVPGILDYSRAAIFAMIRSAGDNVHHFPDSLRRYINSCLTESVHDKPSAETIAAAHHPSKNDSDEEVGRQLAADRGEYVEGISDPNDPKWVHEDLTKKRQPEIARVTAGVFSIEGLMATPAPKRDNEEATSDVQMEETQQVKNEADNPVPAGESADADAEKTDAVNARKILTERCPDLAAAVLQDQEPTITPEYSAEEPDQELTATVWPEYFEPGRYEGVPNEVYHAANGISSTQVKDARISLMYFEKRHVSKVIEKTRSPVLDMGNLVHALALQPEQLEKEFSIEPEIPEGAFTTTATIRAFIDEYNAELPPLLSADDIKAQLEAHNATLSAPVPLGGDKDAISIAYLELPDEFKRIVGDDKNFTASAMKACIKEYNATLPATVKTSGSRDALLEQLAIINPDMVAQEAQKAQPLKVSGTKTDLIQAVKSVKPDAVFADELLDAWRENPEGKILVTRQQMSTALDIQKALLNHPTAGKLLQHPSRAVEVSYFGIDEETGLEVRVRPDLEIDMSGLRIGADLKTISMWNIKQEGLRAKLHREITERDYHLSAAMYCETAALDQFFWIFVNKDESYHWIAIIEASEELLELGMLEYRKAMRAIANGFDTGEWPAPITEDYAEELNDFDVRRLEALRVQA